MSPQYRFPFDEFVHEEQAAVTRAIAEFCEKHPEEAKRIGFPQGGDGDMQALLRTVLLHQAYSRVHFDKGWRKLEADIAAHTMPTLARSVPSLAILQLVANPGANAEREVPRESTFTLSDGATGGGAHEFPFRTTVGIRVLPLEVESVRGVEPGACADVLLEDQWRSVVQVRLRVRGRLLARELAAFRLYVPGEHDAQGRLLEALLRAGPSAWATTSHTPEQPHPIATHAVGLSPEEALLPRTDNEIDACRVLVEYFAFRQKFHFVQLAGLDGCASEFADGDHIDVFVPTHQEPQRLGRLYPHSLQPNCVPAINLFPATTHAVLDASSSEVPVEPAARVRSFTEVHSVVAARTIGKASDQDNEVRPLYARRHRYGRHREDQRHFHVRRHVSFDGTMSKIKLTYVDPQAEPTDRTELALDLLCSNGDAPTQLLGAVSAHSADGNLEARFLVGPTPTLHPKEEAKSFVSPERLARLGQLSDRESGARLREYLEMHTLQGHAAAGGDTDYQRKSIVSSQLQAMHDVSVTYDRNTRTRHYKLRIEKERFGGSIQLFGDVIRQLLGSLCPIGDQIVLSVQTEEGVRTWQASNGDSF